MHQGSKSISQHEYDFASKLTPGLATQAAICDLFTISPRPSWRHSVFSSEWLLMVPNSHYLIAIRHYVCVRLARHGRQIYLNASIGQSELNYLSVWFNCLFKINGLNWQAQAQMKMETHWQYDSLFLRMSYLTRYRRCHTIAFIFMVFDGHQTNALKQVGLPPIW